MKILHTVHSVKAEGGGVVEAILQLSAALKDLGTESEILCLDTPKSISNRNCNFPIHALGVKQSNYGYSSKLKDWLRNHAENFDAVIIHGLWQFHGYGTYSVLKKLKKPLLIYPHGMLDPWFSKQYPIKHLKKSIYWLSFERLIFNYAKAVCYTCIEERNLAQKTFPFFNPSLEVITGLGINKAPPLQGLDKESIYKRYPQLNNTPYLLFLGRIHEKKGLDELLNAFSKLKTITGTRFQLLIAGPSDDSKYLQSLQKSYSSLSDDIIWCPLIQGCEKWSALKNADAMILPSHQENFGIVVAEALSVGTPVLISNKVNIWQEIQTSNAGLVEEDTLEGTYSLLEKWSNLTPDDKEGYSKNSIHCFNKYFTIESTAKKLHSLLLQVRTNG